MSFKSRGTGRLTFIAGMFPVLLFLSPSAFAQSDLLSHRYRTLVDSASDLIYSDFFTSDALLSEAEDILTKAGIRDHPFEWIELNHQRAIACIYNHKFSQTRGYLQRSFNELTHAPDLLPDHIDSLWYSTLFLKSIYLNGIGKYDSALLHLLEIEKYYKDKPRSENNCRELYRVLQFQATIYVKKGEYESGINGYLASNQYYDCYRDRRYCPNYVLTFRNTGEAFLQKGDLENALINFWKGRRNLETCLSEDSPGLKTHALTLYQSIARLYTRSKDLDSATYYLRLALPLLKDNKTFTARIYESMALVELERGNFSEAFERLQAALTFLQTSYGEKHRLTADIYRELSQINMERGDYDAALSFVQKAINSLSGKEMIGRDPSHNPSLHHVFSKKDMANILNLKGEILLRYYKHKPNKMLLDNSHETTLLALQLLDSMRNDFTLEKDKVILGEEAVKMFETSISISHERYRQRNDIRHLRECFELIDRSKGAVLLDHLKLVRRFSGVPSDILERERQLKAELTIAEEQLFREESQGKDASRERESLGDLKKDFAQLFSEIRTSYPAYYKLRIENKSISFNEVQNSLLVPGQALVEYFLGDTSLFIMCITKAGATLHSLSYPSIKEDVVDLKDLITRPNVSPTDLRQLSNTLYRKLVSSWITDLDSSITSLIIIPHGVLSYLPFEMLSDGKNILLDRFRISYASSASLLVEQKQMTVAGSSFAGFNAEYSQHDIYQPLMGSQSELNSIREIFDENTTLFFNSTADQFRQHAPDFKVLHLALHSFINDEKPLFSKLVFSTDASGNTTEITANELYAMQLNAELAVLSACESGIGKLHKGEGMMSLSRAFMYAGVPSTVISLWKVPDHATARLMEKFYTFLKEGQRKDEALANAKRSFIKEYPEMSSPYFWAGFIVNGKCDPITFSVFESAQWSRVIIVVLFIALIVTAIIQWRRHHTKERSVQAFVNQR